MKWHKRFLDLAKLVSTWSKDPSTKCGAVITDAKVIVSTGYNGFPRGVDDSLERYADRAIKLRMVIHAEKNAILFARRDLTGCTLYVWPIPPCSQCAAYIIQAGIKQVYSVQPSPEHIERWGADFNAAFKMFEEAGVSIDYI